MPEGAPQFGVDVAAESRRFEDASRLLRRGGALLGLTAVAALAPAVASADTCTTTTFPDGSQAEICSPDVPVTPPQPEIPVPQPQPEPSPVKPPNNQPKETNTYTGQLGFRGYNMASSSLTSGNGCYITATGSAFRRLKGNPHITPRSIYKVPAVRKRWSPGGGVKGFLGAALPAVAKRFDARVEKVGFKGARRALKSGGQVIILAASGYFAGGSGHYMAGRKAASGNRIVIDDPNGKGKHNNSERKKGWSQKELANRSVIGYYALYNKKS